MKTRTIGQTAIRCYTKHEEHKFNGDACESGTLIYSGLLKTLPEDTARKFAWLHPSFVKYYAHALAVLWKGGGKFAGGTESAVMAVTSMLPSDTKFIIVKAGITHE